MCARLRVCVSACPPCAGERQHGQGCQLGGALCQSVPPRLPRAGWGVLAPSPGRLHTHIPIPMSDPPPPAAWFPGCTPGRRRCSLLEVPEPSCDTLPGLRDTSSLALFQAVKAGDTSLVNNLLLAGYDVNTRDRARALPSPHHKPSCSLPPLRAARGSWRWLGQDKQPVEKPQGWRTWHTCLSPRLRRCCHSRIAAGLAPGLEAPASSWCHIPTPFSRPGFALCVFTERMDPTPPCQSSRLRPYCPPAAP
jgi:hypothetical protein